MKKSIFQKGKENTAKLLLVPTIYPKYFVSQSSILPSASPQQQRKPPKERQLPDQYAEFLKQDKITSFEHLDESCATFGFSFKRFSNHVVFIVLNLRILFLL